MAAIQEIDKARADVVPAGWFRIADVAEEMDVSERIASSRLAAMCSCGKAERRTFRILTAQGHVAPVSHWRRIK